MNKKIVISTAAVFAVMAFAGCGNTEQEAQQQAQTAQMQNEINAQQQEMDEMKATVQEKEAELKEAGQKLAEETCEQKLELAKTQLALLNKYVADLEDLDQQVKKSPEFAVETCRNLNPGLSKPECETRVKDYMNGKKTEYDEAQTKITELETEIAGLETKCAAGTEEVAPAPTKQTCAEAGGVWSEEQNSCFEDPSTMSDEGQK